MVTLTMPDGAATVAPRRRVGSLGDLARQSRKPRFVILALAFLTYIWRFQELHPLIQPLQLTAIATIGMWLLLPLQTNPQHLRRVLSLSALPLMLAFILWVGITSPLGLDPLRSMNDWKDVHVKSFVLMLFVAVSASSVDNVKRMMSLNVIGAAVLAAFYVKGGFGLWGSPVTTYDVNDLALHLNMALPMVLYFIAASNRKKVRVALWILVALFAVCILRTQSRGGFLTLGILTVVTMVRLKEVKPLVRVLPFLLLLSTYPLLPEATRARLSTIFNPTDDYNFDSEDGRIEIWKRGIGYVARHPVTGVGVRNFVVAERTISARTRPQVSHNSFVEVVAENGIPGLLMYVSSIFLAIFAAFRLARSKGRHRGVAERDASAVASAIGLSLVSFCVGGFFLSMAHMQLLIVLIAMVAGLSAVAAKQRARAAAAMHARRIAAS